MLENPEEMDFVVSGCSVVLNLSRSLQESDLLYLQHLGVEWEDNGKGGPFYYTRISGEFKDSHRMAESIQGSRPEAYSGVDPYRLDMIGPGNWVSHSGLRRGEPHLLSVSIGVAPEITSVEVSVHQDIWGENNFFGKPHPEIYSRNSSRLYSALMAVEVLLGGPAEAGEPTYFGSAKGYHVHSPKKADGSGLDVTERL